LDGPGGAAMGQAHVHGVARIALDNQTTERSLKDWLTEPGQQPVAVTIHADWPFNIIYSSGTTGEPKGIVPSHGMRWTHVRRGAAYHYDNKTVTLLSTPLHSNATRVVFYSQHSALAARWF